MKITSVTSSVCLLFAAIFIAVSCTKESNGTQADVGSSAGTGGSLARFTIAAGHLYIVDRQSINIYSLSNPSNPAYVKAVSVGFGIETIFPYGDKLFIGAETGMYIYSITNASSPQLLGKALHLRACDPVVANDSTAFVTLRGGTPCGSATDGLYIYNIKKITEPVLIKQIGTSTPAGLGLKDSILYVCLKENGLAVYNVKKPSEPLELMKLKPTGRKFMDVIPYSDLLICYVDNGILLYDIAAPADPKLIHSIANN
jgi:hypothetical protein